MELCRCVSGADGRGHAAFRGASAGRGDHCAQNQTQGLQGLR